MGINAKNGCVQIGNTSMYYVSFGTGEKKVVVLPGLSDGLATVKGKAYLIAPPYRKFLKDYAVYMFSRKNDMPIGYTIRQMAEDQVEAMKILGINKASVFGVSQGGMVSQCIAIDHPEVVDKLVLAVTAPYANDVVKGAVESWIEMANKREHKTLMIDTAERTYTKAYIEKNRTMLSLVAKFTRHKSYERFLRNAEAILKFDARDELCKIKAPTLLIAGDEDITVGTDAVNELREGIANSETYIYEGLGHGLFDEAKDFYDRAFEFIGR